MIVVFLLLFFQNFQNLILMDLTFPINTLVKVVNVLSP